MYISTCTCWLPEIVGITIVGVVTVECVNDELDSKLVNIGVLDKNSVDEPVMHTIY